MRIFEKLDFDNIGEASFKSYMLCTVNGVKALDNIGLRCIGKYC